MGLRRQGADLVYQVEVSGQPQRLLLPLHERRDCPHCQGSGRLAHGRGPCPHCAGRGYLTSSRLLPVDLPAAWRPGQVFSLPGQESPGAILVELLSAGAEASKSTICCLPTAWPASWARSSRPWVPWPRKPQPQPPLAAPEPAPACGPSYGPRQKAS